MSQFCLKLFVPFQMHVLYVMSFVVERVGRPIRPHVSNLIQYLPLAWEESADHSMLRCAIVSTLVQIVKVRIKQLIKFFFQNHESQ